MTEGNGGTPVFEQPDFGTTDEDDFDDDLDLDEVPGPVGRSTDADDEDYDEGEAFDEEDDEGGDEDEEDEDSPNRATALPAGAARAVVGFVTESLVDDPSAVVVETSEGRSGARYSVRVAPGDMGRVIGRKGRTVQALRTLVRAAAATEGRDASVEVVD